MGMMILAEGTIVNYFDMVVFMSDIGVFSQHSKARRC